MQVTIDTNRLIDLENWDCQSRSLIRSHEDGAIQIQIPGIIASERVQGGGYLPNFAAFDARVQRLSQRPMKILRPIGRWGVTYWDHGLWADDQMEELEMEIHTILFPTHYYRWAKEAPLHGLSPSAEPPAANPAWRKWRNRLCDCAALWCHIYYSGNMFITTDNNFLKSKRVLLENLGASRIRNPNEALSEISLTAVPSAATNRE